MLKTMRGRPDLSEREKLDALHVHFLIGADSLESESFSGPVNAVPRAAKILGRSKRTVSTIIKTLLNETPEENNRRG